MKNSFLSKRYSKSKRGVGSWEVSHVGAIFINTTDKVTLNWTDSDLVMRAEVQIIGRPGAANMKTLAVAERR